MLPAIGNVLIGLDLSSELAAPGAASKQETDFSSINPHIFIIGRLYTAGGLVILVVMLLGCNPSAMRRRNVLNIYITGLVLASLLLAMAGAWCFVASLSIEDDASDWKVGLPFIESFEI